MTDNTTLHSDHVLMSRGQLFVVTSSNRLYLTEAEADFLAKNICQQLVCRIASQADDPVVVADMKLTVTEAWELLDKLQCSLTEDEVDWLREGL